MDREPLRGKIRAKGSSGQTDLRGLRADHGDQTLPGGWWRVRSPTSHERDETSRRGLAKST